MDNKLAFISPCIAKKTELNDTNTHGYVSYNLTFEHFMKYVRAHSIYAEPIKDEIEYGLGSIYPMPGGLKDQDYKKRLQQNATVPFMVDILNCDKGCIYGTGVEEDKSASEDTYYSLQRIKNTSKRKFALTPFSVR